MIDLGGTFKHCTTLDEDSMLGTYTCADHDGSGGAQTKGTWASEDDDGDAEFQANHHFTSTTLCDEDCRGI